MRTHLMAILIGSSAFVASTRPAVAQAADASVAAVPAAAARAGSADTNIDRAFIQPTAMTQPAGSLTYNNYELLLHGLTYGVTDNVQASVTVLAPIVRDMPFVGFAALKARLAATERLHLAVQGSAAFGHAFDSSSGNPNGYSVGAGAYASFCLRDDCSSLFNASANYQYGTATGDGGGGHLLIYGGSIVHRVASHVKVLAEVTSAAGKSGSKDLDNISGFLVSYGVRFNVKDFAGDVGFIKPVVTDGGSDNLLLGLPFVNVSYRWN